MMVAIPEGSLFILSNISGNNGKQIDFPNPIGRDTNTSLSPNKVSYESLVLFLVLCTQERW